MSKDDPDAKVRTFLVTFYVPDDNNGLVVAAQAMACGVTDADAAKKAYAELKPQYPEIQPGTWLAVGAFHRGDTVPRRPS